MKNINSTTEIVIKDLIDDIDDMLHLESNIEVIWALEKLQQDDAINKSIELIRKSLK